MGCVECECTVCMYGVYVQCACTVCMDSVHVLCARTVCMYCVRVLCACTVCMDSVQVLYPTVGQPSPTPPPSPPQKLYRNPHHPGLVGMVNTPTHRAHRLVNMRRVLHQLELHPCMPLQQLWRVGDLVGGVEGAAQALLEDIACAMQQQWGGRGYSGRVPLCACVLQR